MDVSQVSPEQKRFMLGQAIQYLKQQCMLHMPAESILDYIVVNSGNPQYQIVINEILNMSFEDIANVDPTIRDKPFHEFFRVIYDGLRSEFIPEDSVENDTRGHPGDDPNAGNHGDPGPEGQ